MDRFWNDSGGNFDGGDVWRGDPTAERSSHQDTGEQDGGEEKMASVFSGCKGATGGTRLAGARVERDVLDIMMSRAHLELSSSRSEI